MELMSLVPDFTLPATGGFNFQLSAMRGAPLVLYFYPKDDTPGCTDEGLQFKTLYEEFKQLKCSVMGISRDSIASHERFKSKFDYPFPLLSDADEIACTLFDVIKMKNMYGKQVRGIQRSTFVIDSEGKLRQEWRGVNVPGHAQAVLDCIKSL
ncbi:MAG: peroxiredoxin [Ferrovum sp. 37-45-19]|uniref:peroxiredoxin n=1 Tax=Ferrovum sp. JA12 TaxID=1356299 RepID=UPI0007034A8B|nr:peroxiredoxin [Ferrovum sp. JA12]OYV79128.1 MAG: peroxiredoxin [Ferrovum sp. 21-44-67]OYV93743.1 MAG: peroxiredoxin [Ferrovum sp. 37-45-19]OZB32273.1 MAG: peroxiredoxin [Ferrovum sp. 34-44-207]HQT81351.1 peroxiredoxin [Ferrovaceae bacterium]KRH78555.1 putative peroxiredoxin bcp [Ferrovum sp. JA12]